LEAQALQHLTAACQWPFADLHGPTTSTERARLHSALAMVTTRRRAHQETAQQPDAPPGAPRSAQPNTAAAAEKPKKVPWYHYTAPEENFVLHPDDDADVPLPIQLYLLPAAIMVYLLWSVIAGKPPWPPVVYDC
jgi:hypothetical protein